VGFSMGGLVGRRAATVVSVLYSKQAFVEVGCLLQAEVTVLHLCPCCPALSPSVFWSWLPKNYLLCVFFFLVPAKFPFPQSAPFSPLFLPLPRNHAPVSHFDGTMLPTKRGAT